MTIPLSPRAYQSVPSSYDQLQRKRRERAHRIAWEVIKSFIIVCGAVCVLTGATLGLIVIALICWLLEKL